MNLDSKRNIQLGVGIAVFIFAVTISYFFGITEDTSEHDVYLVLDVSGSMGSPLSKLQFAKSAAQEFVNLLELNNSPEFRVGLIAFSKDVYVVVNLTNDQNKLNDGISQLQPIADTALGDAILTATNEFSTNARPDAKKSILLMSDGVTTYGSSPQVAAGVARANGVSIFAVGYGSDADDLALSQIAGVTGGKSYTAATGQDLIETFSDIAENIISPVAHYGSRTLILIAIPIILFIPAIEKGITTFMGKRPSVSVCSRCEHANAENAKFCAKCGNPMRRS